MYKIENNTVIHEDWYLGGTVLDADLASFEVLKDESLTQEDHAYLIENHYTGYRDGFMAKDKNTVWYKNRQIPEADAASIEYFFGGQCVWARDKNNIYCLTCSSKPTYKIIKTKAPESFGFYKEEPGGYMRLYAFTDKHILYWGKRIKDANPNDFHFVTIEYIYTNNEDVDILKTEFSYDSFCAASNGNYYDSGHFVDCVDGKTVRIFKINFNAEDRYSFIRFVVDKNNIFIDGQPITKEHPFYNRLVQRVFDYQKEAAEK